MHISRSKCFDFNVLISEAGYNFSLSQILDLIKIALP